MTDSPLFSLLKPTVDTAFHIDFHWWKTHEHDWHVHLEKCLCEGHKAYFAEVDPKETIDWIHPETAEVQQVDALQHMLIEHCARQPEFCTPQTTLVEAVFRMFLANGNTALTPRELETLTGKDATTILRTIGGHKVYMGIRPFQA
ncbi:MAG: hypothetical protein HPY85_03685 [Anaerolineae bacterium]|nr:hypothetical protein [Anaerolineae bacterium]